MLLRIHRWRLERKRRKLAKASPCNYPSEPCKCTNGIGCINVPFERW